jgi:heme/copper-type cytochrome/quinol oxidase subunit 2
MYGHDGWDWLWMTLTMGFWLVVLGVVVYVAVRLAQRDRGKSDS